MSNARQILVCSTGEQYESQKNSMASHKANHCIQFTGLKHRKHCIRSDALHSITIPQFPGPFYKRTRSISIVITTLISRMASPVSPWYDKDLEVDKSAKLPTGFGVVTSRDDITKDNFLVAISNQSVPSEAVMCYATFLCKLIKHGKKQHQCTMSAPQLKRIGESLINLVHGKKKGLTQKNTVPSVFSRAIQKKSKSTADVISNICCNSK